MSAEYLLRIRHQAYSNWVPLLSDPEDSSAKYFFSNLCRKEKKEVLKIITDSVPKTHYAVCAPDGQISHHFLYGQEVRAIYLQQRQKAAIRM